MRVFGTWWVSCCALVRVFDTRSHSRTPLPTLGHARQQARGAGNVSGAVCRLRCGVGVVLVALGNGESPPAGVRAGSLCAPRWALRWGCALVHACGHDDDVGVAVVAGGGVVVGFGGAGVGVGDEVGGAGEAV